MEYELYKSYRKTISISINEDGKVIVKAPRFASRVAIERFLSDKEDWINKHIEKQLLNKQYRESVDKLTEFELKQYASILKSELPGMLDEYSKRLGVKYGRVTIRAQHTRWGSCSGKGNLNFNCLLAATPESVTRYVVVHELCHLLEMNHSKRFWALVESVLPDYKKERKWLKENGSKLISRLP